MKPLTLLWANTLSLVLTLAVNYTAGTGAVSEQSIGEISSQYPTLITPAGWAFSIWGFIYLLLIAFVAYQWVQWRKDRNDETLRRAGPWFFLTNLANALWVFVWLQEAMGLSVLVMLFLLFSLVQLVLRLKLEMEEVPRRTIFFVWWPVCIYIGWIVLASVVNISVYLKSAGLLLDGLSPEVWTIVVLLVAGLIYLFLTKARNMREAALVGVWGISAIAYKQWNQESSVAITALVIAALLLIYAVWHGISHHKSAQPNVQRQL